MKKLSTVASLFNFGEFNNNSEHTSIKIHKNFVESSPIHLLAKKKYLKCSFFSAEYFGKKFRRLFSLEKEEFNTTNKLKSYLRCIKIKNTSAKKVNAGFQTVLMHLKSWTNYYIWLKKEASLLVKLLNSLVTELYRKCI